MLHEIRLLTLPVLVAMLLLAEDAQAVDPICDNAVQPASLDLSGGTATLCLSRGFANGTDIDPSKILTCTVEFFDGIGVSIGTQVLTGGPGTAHTFIVPEDGVGNAKAICVLDGETSVASTPSVNFPPQTVPTSTATPSPSVTPTPTARPRPEAPHIVY